MCLHVYACLYRSFSVFVYYMSMSCKEIFGVCVLSMLCLCVSWWYVY